jgi:hypothetical protein
MAMTALSVDVCEEILEDFRLHLPDTPDSLRQELARNYGTDALSDIDPNDITGILSLPGTMGIVTTEFVAPDKLAEGLSALFGKAVASGLNIELASGALFIVKGNGIRIVDFGHLLSSVQRALHPDSEFGSALYHVKNTDNSVRLMLILAGMNKLDALERVSAITDMAE